MKKQNASQGSNWGGIPKGRKTMRHMNGNHNIKKGCFPEGRWQCLLSTLTKPRKHNEKVLFIFLP
jgi:hypothetical protein